MSIRVGRLRLVRISTVADTLYTHHTVEIRELGTRTARDTPLLDVFRLVMDTFASYGADARMEVRNGRFFVHLPNNSPRDITPCP